MEKKEVKILITGSNGFIAKNLTIRLKRNKDHELMLANRSTDEKELKRFARSCDAVFHLAGVNRPEHEREFWDGNVGYTLKLLDFLKENQKQLRFIFASSIQAKLDNPYGRSKLAAEQELIRFAAQKKSKLTIFRLPNVCWIAVSRLTRSKSICAACLLAPALPVTDTRPPSRNPPQQMRWSV